MMPIRRARLKDFSQIYDFINALEETLYDRERQREIFKTNIFNKNNIYLVAVDKENIIGYLSCHVQLLLHHGGAVAEIQEMFVRQSLRERGIGKLLLDHLKDILQKAHIVQLEVTSNNQRTATHAFYEREGFILSHKKFVWKFLP